MKISEVQFAPIKPKDGLVGFASCVIYGEIYIGSIAVRVKTDGEYRILYPTKKLGDDNIPLFHPINKATGKAIEKAIIEKCEQILNQSCGEDSDDRHGKNSHKL